MKTQPESRGVTVATRLSEHERRQLFRVAADNDRTPSREIRRAIRYYLANLDAAAESLRPLREPDR